MSEDVEGESKELNYKVAFAGTSISQKIGSAVHVLCEKHKEKGPFGMKPEVVGRSHEPCEECGKEVQGS